MLEIVTYSALISTCEKGKQLDQALSVFAAMEQQGVVPNAITYSVLVSAFEKGKQPEQALKVFEQLLE